MIKKILKNEANKGLTYTLNRCLKVATGEDIARMDDDDISHAMRFERQVEILERNNDIAVVSTCANIIDDNGKWSEREYKEYIVKEDFLFNNPVMHPTIMGRKSVFDDIGGYCDKKYTNCFNDMEEISKDRELLTNLNNFLDKL